VFGNCSACMDARSSPDDRLIDHPNHHAPRFVFISSALSMVIPRWPQSRRSRRARVWLTPTALSLYARYRHPAPEGVTQSVPMNFPNLPPVHHRPAVSDVRRFWGSSLSLPCL
jgi:hypothetical protein